MLRRQVCLPSLLLSSIRPARHACASSPTLGPKVVVGGRARRPRRSGGRTEGLAADAERKGRIARLQAVVFTLEKMLIATEGEERDEVGAPPLAEEGDASEPRRMSGSGSCVKRRRRIGTDS